MKKILLYAVLLFTAIGCQVSPLDEEVVDPTLDLVSVTIKAQLPAKGEDTRVSVTPSDESVWKSSWEEDDFLTLLSTENINTPQTLNIESIDQESGIATFTGEVYQDRYEVYTGVIDEIEGGFVYSEQLASDKCTKMPMKAMGELVVSSNYNEISYTPLYFNHLSQVMELNVSLSNVTSQYALEYIEILGKDGEIDYGFDNVKVIFSDKSLSSAEDFSVYCYLPRFTVPADGNVNFSVQISDNSGVPYTIKAVATNTTGSKVEFEIGKHNYLNVAFDFTNPTTDNWIDYVATTFADDTRYADDEDFYMIRTAEELALLAKLVSEGNDMLGKTFILVKDIDLGSKEFTAIGTYSNSFKGTFEGSNNTVSGLYINQPNSQSPQALFGNINGATIENVTVSGSVTGMNYVAGIVGYNYYSSVTNCNNNATINGTGDVGGIVGINENSSVVNCYNTATIIGSKEVGGVVGWNSTSSSSLVVNCYNTGAVEGASKIGGVVGSSSMYSSVTNCYNSATVEGSSKVGGVVGSSYGALVTNCYWPEGVASNGVGYDHYNGETGNDIGTEPITTTEMQGEDLVTLLNNGAYCYNQTAPAPAVNACAWAKSSTYPVFDHDTEPSFKFQGQGTEEEPYLIASANDLRQFSTLVNAGESYSGKYFEMTNDIDLKNEEFTAIGYWDERAHYTFQGTFDGGFYEISRLYINSSSSNQGLFGAIDEATIKNLGVSGSVTGASNVGGVVGRVYAINNNFSNITNCYNKATVKATGESVGGIVGYTTYSNIANCYNLGTVSSSSSNNAGGITGSCNWTSTITNCYNTGAVSASKYSGGIIGSISVDATNITNCYNTGTVSSTSTLYYGGIAGRIGSGYSGDLTNCYWLSDVASNGIGCDYSTENYTAADRGAISKSDSEMQASGFTTLLNNNAYTYNQTSSTIKACGWAKLTSYPTLDFDAVPAFSQLDSENPGTGL